MTRRLLSLVTMAVVAGSAPAADDPMTFVPETARAAAAEGDAAFKKGDFVAARRAFAQVVDLAPGNLVGLVNRGLAEFRSGDAAAAENTLKQAVQIRLETAPAWLTLGVIYFDTGRLDEAHAALAQAVLYDKGNGRAHNYLGAVLARKGWLDGAAAELRRAVQIDPADRDAHYNLALVYLQEKPPALELARRHYFRSLELGAPKDASVEKSLNAAAAKADPPR